MSRHYLLVDDNRELAENLAEILRDRGSEVTVVEGGAQAVEQVRRVRFDALMTDMRMPLMSGAELVHEIRRIDPGLPAIVCTAYAGDEHLRVAKQEGLLTVFSKPVPVPTMLDLLTAARRDGLLVMLEDDAALLDNLSEVFRARGFTPIGACSVLESERIGEVQPFAAVVDLKLPDAPLGEGMKRLSQRFPGIPLLAITAHSERGLDLPRHQTFRKPFRTEELLGELERLYQARVRL